MQYKTIVAQRWYMYIAACVNIVSYELLGRDPLGRSVAIPRCLLLAFLYEVNALKIWYP